jgi:hypothetical protein
VSARGRPRPGRLPRESLAEREDAVRELCFCLLYDLCAWLCGARRPIPPEVHEYRLAAVRQLAEARERLRHYLHPELLEHLESALHPFFVAGAALSVELGEAAPLEALGLDRGGRVRAEIRFSEQSSLIDRFGRHHPLPRCEWALEAWLSDDLKRVENACLRLA